MLLLIKVYIFYYSMEMYEFDPDWAPSLHLGHTQVKASSVDNGRLDRRNKRRQAAVQSNTGPATVPDVKRGK